MWRNMSIKQKNLLKIDGVMHFNWAENINCLGGGALKREPKACAGRRNRMPAMASRTSPERARGEGELGAVASRSFGIPGALLRCVASGRCRGRCGCAGRPRHVARGPRREIDRGPMPSARSMR
ncbi:MULTISPECIES: hypothetical protein [Burkholderia]|uniref:hypothetical protein n=1 Tax=Burkholderia TaxID=32008 RepID=UPI001269EAE1|nr:MULTISPECIES: hypothetical protein [Burkholderia]